jgi:ADP-ribose pyrophosphatase YjhB (NUDIX family)
MTGFENSYLGQLRKLVGPRMLLVPGARVVIENNGGEILLQKRSDFGIWGLPGGNAEIGEDLETVAPRDVKEETGLRVFNLQPFGFGSDPEIETVQFPNGDLCQFFVLNFFTTEFDGTLRLPDEESLQLGWFASHALPKLLPNMQRSVDAYVQFKQTGQFQTICEHLKPAGQGGIHPVISQRPT